MGTGECRFGYRKPGEARKLSICVADHGYGYELFNFQKNGQFAYGYVQAGRGTINIDRLGADGEPYIDDVLVVWRARSSVFVIAPDGLCYCLGQRQS